MSALGGGTEPEPMDEVDEMACLFSGQMNIDKTEWDKLLCRYAQVREVLERATELVADTHRQIVEQNKEYLRLIPFSHTNPVEAYIETKLRESIVSTRSPTLALHDCIEAYEAIMKLVEADIKG